MQAPRLDPRTLDDLRRELLRRVPLHAPDWTDLGPADPGVALLELFAWMGERLLRRMDQIPAESEEAMLRLLGLPRRPAVPARAWVVATLRGSRVEPVRLLADGLNQRAKFKAGTVEFQATTDAVVLPVEGLVALKRVVQGGLAEELTGPAAALAADHLGDPQLRPVFYETQRLPGPRAGRLGEPYPLADTVDGALWIALLAPVALVPTGMAALRRACAGQILSVGVVVDEELGTRSVSTHDARTPEISWQIASGGFLSARPEDRRVDRLRYDRLRVEADGTAGLGRSGVVRLRLPSELGDLDAWRLRDEEGNALDGLGELPPALDDEALEARVLTWIRAHRPADAPPAIRWAVVNAVEVTQSVAQPPEVIGTGAGQPGQRVALSRTPVLAESVVLEVREAEPFGWQLWRRVPDFGSSLPDDLHYVLDPVSGQVRFGDGVQGRMPRYGEAIRVWAWQAGGGAVGNVPAGAINRVEGGAEISVSNPLPATGGRDGETDAEVRGRAPTALRNQDRAVSPSDYRELALLTPGVHLGRVEVLPLHKPDDPGVRVAGAITLVVVPARDAAHPDEPSPDQEAARAVLAWLEPRRLVTTELYVRGPVYVPVWLAVAIELSEGYGPATVGTWVDLALRQHFAPLPPYGPAGQGWPMGRALQAKDAEAAALAVRGVRLVHELVLLGPDGRATTRVVLQPWELPVVRGVAVVEGSVAPDPVVAPSPHAGGTVISVPVVRERC